MSNDIYKLSSSSSSSSSSLLLSSSSLPSSSSSSSSSNSNNYAFNMSKHSKPRKIDNKLGILFMLAECQSHNWDISNNDLYICLHGYHKHRKIPLKSAYTGKHRRN